MKIVVLIQFGAAFSENKIKAGIDNRIRANTSNILV